MKTSHEVHFGNASAMGAVPAGSVALVVTSPPYPMIEMWDAGLASQNPAIGEALSGDDGWLAFRLMHELLAPVWAEVHRVLVDGGIACINIGDATRTIGGEFALYPNHARILSALVELGFTPLPAILWRKQTNAPNKFMGSGMLPAGAYVTLEHEYVLIARKGGKRRFTAEEAKANRRSSSFFWEERNNWFSDVWFDLKGARQELGDREARDRSGAFPFELPYRLISMFSVKGDTVLDPFMGLGTTMYAAMATARNSVGFEIDANLAPSIEAGIAGIRSLANARTEGRLEAHTEFVAKRLESAGSFGHRNRWYNFPVITGQETELLLHPVLSIEKVGAHRFEAAYAEEPHAKFVEDAGRFVEGGGEAGAKGKKKRETAAGPTFIQPDLFPGGGGGDTI